MYSENYTENETEIIPSTDILPLNAATALVRLLSAITASSHPGTRIIC